MRKATRVLLLLYVFAIPWEYSLDLGAPFGNVARILGLLALLVAVPAVSFAGNLRRPCALMWLTGALYLWFCCSCFWTLAPYVTLLKLRGYAQEMMVVWLVWEFVGSPDDLRDLLRAWLAGSWVLALLTLSGFIWPGPDGADVVRFVAAGQDPNDTARFLDFGFPLASLLLDGGERRWERILALGYSPLALAGILLTGSRSGFLVALVAMIGSATLVAHRSFKALLGGSFALPAMAAAVWAVAPRETLERLGTISEQLRNGDLNQRVNIWRAGWQAFLHAPLLGHGAGSFVTAAGLAPFDTAHNTLLAIAVEGGLCAVALTSAIVLVSVNSIMGTRGAIRVGLWTLMAVWISSSLVGTVGENRTTWVMFAVFAVSKRISEEQPERWLASFPVAIGTQVCNRFQRKDELCSDR